MKQKWWKALPMLLMMAVLGSGSVRTWKNLAVQAADAAALTTDTVEKTAQESVPFYHGMINLNTFFQMTLGKNVIEDTAEGDEVVKLKNGYLTFVCEPADVTESARSLLSLQETCKENGAELYFVLTPQKISKYDPELPTGVQDNYNPMADAFLAQLGGQVHCTDLRQVIHENGINQYNFFFKTDHHWTPEGALYAGVDDFSVITPNYAADFTLTVPDKGIDRSGDYVNTLLVPEMFEKKDLYTDNPYAGYIGGDYGLCHIVNHQPPNDKRVLLVRDSFACAFTPYLAQACAELDTIDKRAFPQTIASYIEETKPDLVLFLYNAAEMPAAENFQ